MRVPPLALVALRAVVENLFDFLRNDAVLAGQLLNNIGQPDEVVNDDQSVFSLFYLDRQFGSFQPRKPRSPGGVKCGRVFR